MRSLVAIAVAICVAMPLVTLAQSPAAASEWLELEAAWNNAHLRGDLSALEKLWADEVSIVVPKMAPFGKRTSIQVWKTVPVKFTRYESTNVVARIYGQTAVVTGAIVRAREFGGRSAVDRWHFTKVYVNRGSTWQVVAFQASDAPE